MEVKLIKSKLLDYLSFLEANNYLNGAVAIGVKDELIVAKGFGFANIDQQIIHSSTTRFKLGSITKSFTAVSILQLYEKGLIDLHCNINNYIDYPAQQHITIHHLLTHSSGIPDFASFKEYWHDLMGLNLSLDQTIALFQDKPLHFEPGTQFSYSNSGFILLTKIIEAVSQMAYGQYIKQFICDEIGLENTGIDNGSIEIQDYAQGYTIDRDIVSAPFIHMSFPQGAYGLYSTVEDLFIYHRALQEKKLLSADSIKLMESTYFDQYGYGWFIYSDKLLGGRCVGHYGDINGFSNQIIRCIDKDIFITVLSNINVTPSDAIAKQLAQIILGQDVRYKPFTAHPIDKTDNLVGTYLCQDNQLSIDIISEAGKLYARIPKRYGVSYDFELICIEADQIKSKFVTKHIYEELTFTFGPKTILNYLNYDGKRYIATLAR